MRLPSDKFIFTVMNTEMFVIANIYKSIISSSSIRMDDLSLLSMGETESHSVKLPQSYGRC